jgi:hypothetical protein
MNQRTERQEKRRREENSAALTADAFRIYPVPTRIEQSEYKKKQISLSLVQKTFSRYLVDFSPSDQSKYWGGSQMAYVPVYAFEEIPAVFGDLPDDQLSICAFIGRLTRVLTQEGSVSLKALPEEMRLRVFEWFQRPSEAKEDAAQLAESAFEQLPEYLRKDAIQVLLRLVQFTQRGTTPQVLNREDLQAGLSDATDELTKARVLKSVATQSGARALQLSDPVILQNWKAYQEWITNDLAFLRWRQSVNTAARSWRIAHQRESDLLREDSLDEAKRYLNSRRDELNNDEQDFIKASADLDQRRRMIDELNRSNREALEKQVTALGQQLALKPETPAKARWYRSPAWLIGSLAVSVAVGSYMYGNYLKELRMIQELKTQQADQALKIQQANAENVSNTVQQMQAQNKMLAAELANLHMQLAAAAAESRKKSAPQSPPSDKEPRSSATKPSVTMPPTAQNPSGSTNQANTPSTQVTSLPATSLTCRIVPTTWRWATTGRLFVELDGSRVGGINVGNDQSGFDFACSPGSHTYRVYGENMSVSCKGRIEVQSRETTLSLIFTQSSPGPPACNLIPDQGAAKK